MNCDYPPEKIIRYPALPALESLSRVKARTGLSAAEIYRRISLGQFPKPVKLTGRSTRNVRRGEHGSGWHTVEIDAWILGKIAERDRKLEAQS